MQIDPRRAHLPEELLSSLVDGQSEHMEERSARSHLADCEECRVKLDELTSLVALLRRLPDEDPPRDFTVGPHVVRDGTRTPVLLARLHAWSRSLGAVAAALCVLLVGADAFDDATRPRPQPTPTVMSVQVPAAAPRAAAAPQGAARSSVQAPPAAAPAPAPQNNETRPITSEAAPSDSTAATTGDQGTQQAASTSSKALATEPGPVERATDQSRWTPRRMAAAVAGALAAGLLIVAGMSRRRMVRTL